MPRPKVPPENRIRGYRACNPCKASKIRCDSQLPCANCTKRSRVASCTYSITSSSSNATRRSTRGKQPHHGILPLPEIVPLSPAISTAAADSRRFSFAEPAASPGQSSHARSAADISGPFNSSHLDQEDASGPTTVGPTVPADDDQDSPQEHFVTGPNGETLYIGENASLSFLDFLRHSLKQLVGATAFTDSQPQNLNLMLDSDVDQDTDPSIRLEMEDKKALFDSYAAISSGILRLFSDQEVQALLENDLRDGEAGIRREDLAAMDTALAIGAQARDSGPEDARNASTLFVRSRAVAFENMLATPSVSVVRLFVLLSFYTLGAFRQIPASIYLGIASKAAVVLGLHQPMSPKAIRQGDDYTSRLRIWHSLCILDVLASSLLGRPCTVPRATRHKIQALPLDPTQPAFNSILKAAVILDDVCCELNRGTILDAPVARKLLTRLRSWGKDLPAELRHFTSGNTSSMSQTKERQLIGNVHVSSVYYFAIILVSRPFLIRSLMPQVRRRVGLASQNASESEDPVLAQVCITAAVHMGQLCGQLAGMAGSGGRSVNTMSLFKAWAFGSGLILGLSMLGSESRPEVNEAFRGVVQLLGLSEEAKPQSQLYTETLKAFADTISIYQRLASLSSSRAADPFVQEILTIDAGQRTEFPGFDAASQPAAPMGWDGHLPFCEIPGTGHLEGAAGQMEPLELPLDFHDWNDFSVPFSGDFGLNFGSGLL